MSYEKYSILSQILYYEDKKQILIFRQKRVEKMVGAVKTVGI